MIRLAAASFALAFVAPLALAGAPFAVNPLVNGNFDTYATASLTTVGRPVLDRCFGVGHQAYDVLYSPWADWALAASEDPAEAASDPALGEQATGWPAAHAQDVASDPSYPYRCDPQYRDTTQLNAWEKSHDTGFGWSNDPGTKFYDHDADGDVEVVIPATPVAHSHNLWQSVASPTQAFSADFDAFEFTLEAGVIPPGANNQIGLALSPGYEAHPFVGVFWEGAVLFRANDMTPDEDGRVRMDPATQGEIVCPGDYSPCVRFRAAFVKADEAGKRALLGEARIVQTSFWTFSGGAGPVVLDDVAFAGAKTAAEGMLGSVP